MPGFLDTTATVHRGSVYSKSYETDGNLWLPAVGGAGGFQFLVGTWTATRAAGGDYYQALTAAANSPQVVIDLGQVFNKIGTDPLNLAIVSNYPPGTTHFPAPTKLGTETLATDSDVHLIRGIQLVEADVYFSIGTAGLTTHTGTLYQTTYNASGAAGTVATQLAATALGAATNANIQIGALAPTAYILGNNAAVVGSSSVADYLEINITNPGTSVYHLYGVSLFFNYCIL